MATLKVTVNKLNLRSSPVKDFANKENVVGVLHKDAVFESVRMIENELGKWHVDGEGNTISEKFTSVIEEGIPPELIKYHNKIPHIFLDFHLGKLWELPMQEGLKVGIIDTGVQKHSAIKQPIIELNPTNEKEENAESPNHGTTMACIIAGNDPENGIIGIAPNIEEIYSYSLPEKEATPDQFLSALIAMEAKDVKLINISYCCSDLNDKFKNHQELISKISGMVENGFIIVCATGNYSNAHPPYYPAAYSATISVAGVYGDLTPDFKSDFWESVSVCMCSEYYFNPHVFEKSWGTSGATAIITGCLARAFQSIKEANRTHAIKQIFQKFSTVTFSGSVKTPLFNGFQFSNHLNSLT